MKQKTPKKASHPTTSIKSSNSQHDTSRLSFSQTNSSQIYTNMNKYPKCQYKKQHNKQLLNLICLTQNCKNRGPICTLCKNNEHSTHNVIPIKKFLQNVSNCMKKKYSKKNNYVEEVKMEAHVQKSQSKSMDVSQFIDIFAQPVEKSVKNVKIKTQSQHPAMSAQKMISQLLISKQKMLYSLSLHVQCLATQIQKIQQKIIHEIDSIIQNLTTSLNLQQNIQKLVNQLKNNNNNNDLQTQRLQRQRQPQQLILIQQLKRQKNNTMDAKSFEQKLHMLMNMINIKTKDNYEINSEGPHKIWDGGMKLGDSFVANINNWAIETQKLLNRVFEYNPHAIKKLGLAEQKQKDSSASGTYKFAQQLKIKSIQLFNQNKIAKQNEKQPGVVLISGPCLKQKRIKFKILNLSSGIMLGICYKDIIKQNGYKINTSSLGHGAYMIGQNSYTYSHHNKANNMVMKGMTFATGQEIIMTIKTDSVNFVKKSDNKSVMIPLKKINNQDEWSSLYGCVYLGGVGDKVQILNQEKQKQK